jgi:hypothetical protein
MVFSPLFQVLIPFVQLKWSAVEPFTLSPCFLLWRYIMNFRTLALAAGVLALMALSAGCDRGLGPITEDTGFSGTITFRNWSPADTVYGLRLVAFEEYPSDSSGIMFALLGGRAAVYPHLTTGVQASREILGYREASESFADTVHFVFTKEGTVLKELTYNYVLLAWQYGPNVFADWAPIGVYTQKPGTFEPAPVFVQERRMREQIDITVDFHNLPPKPWK